MFGSLLASALLLANYSRGMVEAFTFLLMMTTLTTLIPYLICALAELRHSWRRARSSAVVALAAAAYSLFAIFGSGLDVLFWSLVLAAIGLPVYNLVRRPNVAMAGAG